MLTKYQLIYKTIKIYKNEDLHFSSFECSNFDATANISPLKPSIPQNPTYNKCKYGTGRPDQPNVPLIICVEVFGNHKCKVHDVRYAKDDGHHSSYNCNTESNLSEKIPFLMFSLYPAVLLYM